VRWIIYGLAAIGGLTTAILALIVTLAVVARLGEKRRRARSIDARIAQYVRDGSPDALIADPMLWDRYVKGLGLTTKTPKEWRS
jgi:hypothetical protein